MNTYKAFYRGKKAEIQAESSYAAQQAAAAHFKARKEWEVTVMLLEVGTGTDQAREVVHSTAGI
mgnify:CR=1 FL=1|jgi:hypothetical protein